jgi:hypothetical protein
MTPPINKPERLELLAIYSSSRSLQELLLRSAHAELVDKAQAMPLSYASYRFVNVAPVGAWRPLSPCVVKQVGLVELDNPLVTCWLNGGKIKSDCPETVPSFLRFANQPNRQDSSTGENTMTNTLTLPRCLCERQMKTNAS